MKYLNCFKLLVICDLIIGCGNTPQGTPRQVSAGADDLQEKSAVTSTQGVSFSIAQKSLNNKCTPCHANGGSASSYWSVGSQSSIEDKINTSNPESSLLMKKGLGEEGHGGGSKWKKTDSDYKTVLQWIEGINSTNNQSTNNQSTNNQSTNNQSTNNQSTNNQSTNNQSTNNQSTVSFSLAQAALKVTCSPCHVSGGSASGRWSADQESTVRSKINTSNPSGSLLLNKGLGVSHGGGTKWSEGDDEFKTVLQWIEGGAK